MDDNNTFPNVAATIVALQLLLRVIVGIQSHSGKDNHHGSQRAYGGDYEAQRHWMELTLHLPIGDWYWYDLEYWGLDYPPLTAYVSWICGVFSSWLVSPESVALDASRGYEDPTHKAYMRATVLVLDALIYFSIIWVASKRGKPTHDTKAWWTFVLALAQYNSVSLGFALWSFYFVSKESFVNCVVGSVWFCLALNFKQMTLYYAPAIFSYLLGRCFADKSRFVTRFCALGATVIATFAVLWWPFLAFPPSQAPETTTIDRLLHVLHRIFPFQRGLFEGKVANLWCALSVKPFSIRKRIPLSIQPVAALGMTILLILPACYKLFLIGLSVDGKRKTAERDWNRLLWGSASTGLAFFLASFQVHEKSILIPMAPLSLLLWDDYGLVNWFAVASTWTLWPLLTVDRLEVAYFCTILIFLALFWVCSESPRRHEAQGFFDLPTLGRPALLGSVAAMLALHGLEAAITPPASLKDLFPVLWSIAGCGMFGISWVATCWHLLRQSKKDV